ncbi:MAG: InlB B-repeat-containing protein, partial [Eubacteriales bacterium]|nr:InlB B-repeat-containing protein [Eubacteriales bacterium]
MKRNRVVTLIAGMILTTTLAVSAPLTVFGTDVFDNAGSGDTEFAEDSQFAEPEELPEEDTSWDEQLEGDMSGTDFMDGDPTEGDIPDEDITGEDGSGMELPEEDITDESEDIVEPVIYTVKYDMNGHGDSYTEEVEEGAYAVDWAEPPEEEGYTFLGWFADKKCSTLWDSNAPVSSDVTVYAGWEKIEEEVEEEEVQEEVVEEEAGQEETDQNDSQNTTDNSDEGFTEEENSGSGSSIEEEVVEEPAEEEDVSEDAGAAGPTTKKAAEPATDDT